MKKLCLFIVLILAMSPIITGFAANEADEVVSSVNIAKLNTAKTLIAAVSDREMFAEGVTRGEFVDVIAELMKAQGSADGAESYSDVNTEHKYAAGINAAKSLKWLADDDTFRPDDDILMNEALKIAVSAVGYAQRAEYTGGYPTGYIQEAKRLKLLDGIGGAVGTVSGEQAMIIMYNMLNICVADPSYSFYSDGDYGVSYTANNETYLNRLYDIYIAEGVVNATSYNSFEYGTEITTDNKYIEVDGIRLLADEVSPGLLGYRATAFYYDNGTEKLRLAAMEVESGNKTIKCDLKDLSLVSSTEIEHTDKNGKIKKYRLSELVCIYNGRTVKGIKSEYFDGDGYAVLIDNDCDGSYEVIQITSYSYLFVNEIDRNNRKIGDKFSAKNSLDLSGIEEELISLTDVNGEKMSFYDVKPNMLLQVVTPQDLSIAEVKIISDTVSGTVDTVNEDSLVINGVEYRYTEYFKRECLSDILPGVSNVFFVGYDGRLVCVKSETKQYSYGILLKIAGYTALSNAKMQIYTESGESAVYQFADNVLLDGVSMKAEAAYNLKFAAGIDDGRRLIRYKLNSKNELKCIDTSVDYDYATYDARQSENEADRLVYYANYNTTVRYRSGKKLFVGKFSLQGTKCFIIPPDIEDTDYFFAGTVSSLLTHDTDYVVQAYDINEEGEAGAIVIRNKFETLGPGQGSIIVEDLARGLDSEGNIGTIVRGWTAGKYVEYYMSDDVVFKKDSGNELVPGDIIRVKLNSKNAIYALQVDFDYGAFDKCSTLPSNYFRQPNSSISYWVGLPYTLSQAGIAQIAGTRDAYGEYSFSKYDLNAISVNTTNIVRFDCVTGTTRPVTYDEIKTYKAFSDACDYVVVRCNFDAPAVVFLYDGWNERGNR